jgi:putative component of toxin-antitoxin plasmid stabilization module
MDVNPRLRSVSLFLDLLGGGTKKRQHRDIATAIERWKDYKARRSQ